LSRLINLFCRITGKCLSACVSDWDYCRNSTGCRHKHVGSLFWPENYRKFPVPALETDFARLHPPPPSLPKPATYSWLAEMPSCGHFSRAVVSDFRSLRRDIVFRSFLARQSPAAKIPFQTRHGKKVQEGVGTRCEGRRTRVVAALRHCALAPTVPASRPLTISVILSLMVHSGQPQEAWPR